MKTNQEGEMILIHYGAKWSSRAYDDMRSIFTLTVDNGQPKLYARENTYVTTLSNETSLNDNTWHHLAVTMPTSNCPLSKVQLYVDGKKVATETPENDETLFFVSYGMVSFGGLGYSASAYETRFPNWKAYQGSMDEFKLWSRPISKEEVALSMNKNFEPRWDYACEDDSNISKLVLKKKVSTKRCKTKCSNRSWCKGYEAIRWSQGRQRCTLYHERPTKGKPRQDAVCASMM